MTQGIGAAADCILVDRGRSSRKFYSLVVPSVAIVVLSALACVLALHKPTASAPDVANGSASAVTIAANPYGLLVNPGFSSGPAPTSLAQGAPPETPVIAASPSLPIASNPTAAKAPTVASAQASTPFGKIVDFGFSSGSPPTLRMPSEVSTASLAPLPPQRPAEIAAIEVVTPAPPAPRVGQSAPLPPARPAEFAIQASLPAPARVATRQNARVAVAAPSDNRNFLEKLFGAQQHSGPAQAYAAPEISAVAATRASAPGTSQRYDRWTAVYDVAAHTVYLPDGTKLEAHSGLGDRLDDPRHFEERMHGATPPDLYELALREQLFHGVQALRLNPVGDGNVFGRAGLLAHSYMLGPNGDSNGCVSFKDYDAFLQAFHNGQVKRLAVVARLN